MSAPLSPIALAELTFLMSREISDAARDCERLQSTLGGLCTTSRTDNQAIMAMQDLDRITQVLRDVAAVLDTMNPYLEDGEIPPENLSSAVRMDSLLDRLTTGRRSPPENGDMTLL